MEDTIEDGQGAQAKGVKSASGSRTSSRGVAAAGSKAVAVRRIDSWLEVLRARKQRRLIRWQESATPEMPRSDRRAVPGYDVGGRHVVGSDNHWNRKSG